MVGVQQAVCGVQHAVCGVQHAVCGVKHAVCGVQQAVCGVLHAVCSMQCAVCGVQRHWQASAILASHPMNNLQKKLDPAKTVIGGHVMRPANESTVLCIWQTAH